MKTKNRRSPMTFGEILMFTAGILFCLVLITTALMGGMFARYVTDAEGHDSARVAKWSVLADDTFDLVTIDSKVSDFGEYEITVTNQSEVVVSYSFEAVFEKPLDSRLELGLVVDDATQKGRADSENKVITFEEAGELAPGKNAVHQLRFTVNNWGYITENAKGNSTADDEAGKIDFSVNVIAEQID